MVIKWFVNWPPLYPFSDGHFRHLPLRKGECKAIRRFRKLSGPEQGGDKTRRLSFQAVLQTLYIYFTCMAVFCTFPDDFGKLPYHLSSSTASRWWITNYLSWTETHVIHKSLPVKLIISWLRCASKIAFDLCGSRGSWAWCGDAWKMPCHWGKHGGWCRTR